MFDDYSNISNDKKIKKKYFEEISNTKILYKILLNEVANTKILPYLQGRDKWGTGQRRIQYSKIKRNFIKTKITINSIL